MHLKGRWLNECNIIEHIAVFWVILITGMSVIKWLSSLNSIISYQWGYFVSKCMNQLGIVSFLLLWGLYIKWISYQNQKQILALICFLSLHQCISFCSSLTQFNSNSNSISNSMTFSFYSSSIFLEVYLSINKSIYLVMTEQD